MKLSIDLWAVFANVVILLLLASAVARPRTSQLARLVIATSALVCAWIMTAALDSMRAPVWTLFIGGVVIVASIVVVVATLHLWTLAGDAGESNPEHGGDDGGGEPRPRPPDTPRPEGGGNDPTWWPEFERSFALYVAERARGNRDPAAVPTERLSGAVRPAPGRRR